MAPRQNTVMLPLLVMFQSTRVINALLLIFTGAAGEVVAVAYGGVIGQRIAVEKRQRGSIGAETQRIESRHPRRVQLLHIAVHVDVLDRSLPKQCGGHGPYHTVLLAH